MRCIGLLRLLRSVQGWSLVSLLLGIVLAGCAVNPAQLYRTGYDKRLTAERWAAHKPSDAVVIISGYPSVWQNADDTSYAFEARQRFTIDWNHGFDVALIKPGTYRLQTIVRPTGSFAEFGGFQGLGAVSGPVIASFTAAPGEVIYVGDFDAEVLIEGAANCAANLSTRDFSNSVGKAFAKQVPYVQRAPKTDLITIVEPLVRFPCGEDG
jgi:hypothetical protein